MDQAKANYERYLAIWTRSYSKKEFGGGCVATAASYAAMDCMNVVKGWDQELIDDDIAWWDQRIGH